MQNCTSFQVGYNFGESGNIMEFYNIGDTAPDGRFAYQFNQVSTSAVQSSLHATDMQDRLKRLVPSMKRSMQTVPSHSQLSTNILASAESDMPEAFLPQAHRCRFPWQAKTLEFIRACFGMLMVRLIAEP